MEVKKEATTSGIKSVAVAINGQLADLLKQAKTARQEINDISKKLNDRDGALKKAKANQEAKLAREEQLKVEEKEKMLKAEAEKEANLKAQQAEQAAQAIKKAEEEALLKAEKELAEKERLANEQKEAERLAKEQAEEARKARLERLKKESDEREAAERAKIAANKTPREYIPGQRKEYVPNYDRPSRPKGERGAQGFENRQGQPRQQGDRTRPVQGDATRPQGQRPMQGAPRGGMMAGKPQEVAFIPKDNKQNYNKKKSDGKSYDDKRAVNKKSAMRGMVNVSDFDEDRSGYRKVRPKKNKSDVVESRIKVDKAVITKEIIPLKELSEKLGVSAVEITKILFKEGIIKTINDSIDFDTAGFVAAGLGIELELKLEKTAEDVLNERFTDEPENDVDAVLRPPVVTVMGHVDHGKTSLLDYIRSAHVTAGEAGGITQHIGAYQVVANGSTITFLDTPGHAAFTSMRARGAQVTDIAVIVIAADDGIMPQTVEAINHAKAAGVSIIVAANKIDKQHANIDRVRQQLSERDILVEDWGGDVILVPVSAKTGAGVDQLLESILLLAEMKELKANPNRLAKGAVIEAKLDKGKGPVATILIQNGTLHTGDFIVAGTSTGKVRAMFDDKGRMVKEAGPSMPVSVLGLEEVPNAGDVIFSVADEKLMKLVAEERKNKEREEMIRRSEKVTLDELFSKISDGQLKNLNIIIKADVQGSVEAVKQSLVELSNNEVKVNVIHAGVGAINETDVMLADSSNSIIIGFNVRPDSKAKVLAERQKIDVKLYRVIYEAIEEIQAAMKGMLAPKFTDIYMGKVEVRETFKITGVGMVAGAYVTDGKIVRSGKLRIYREDVMICEGNVLQLKRFKDDVKEVAAGYECGISIENFNDIKVGDFIECYIVEQQKD